jgi:cell division septation protein DedD
MNTTFRIFLFAGVISLSLVSCKSKQKVTEIPAANVPATTETTPVVSPRTATARTTQPEVTRSETFRLADGETNTAAMSKKYHVVVGAFGNHDNARRLRTALSNQGNNAFTVQNESGMLRVIIASFDEYAQAKARIDQIKSTYADAWVLVQK